MKILQIRLGDKTFAEKIISEENNVIKTKSFEVKRIDGILRCDYDDFKGATIVNRGFIKNIFKKIGE